MQVVMSVDGDDDVLLQLQKSLGDRPELAGIDVQRAPAQVRQGELGAGEVLAFIATEVSLPFVITAVYDFFRKRRRSRPAEKVRVVLTLTDLPDGARQVELQMEGTADAAVKAIMAVLQEPNAGG